ncbi:MAG: SGNH/GDSL hydrolase family protein [Draconibacterium sp.]|nr:SGNH/GDSL hydrolase family protein [Draconibacterium sp.]
MQSRRIFLKNSVLFSSMLVFPNIGFSVIQNKFPKVLIIGDSISIGYTPFVKEQLKFYAEVSRPMLDNGKPENCSGTTKGVENIDRWIGDTKWDLIHFNFGLHDIKHVDPITGENSNKPEDPHQASIKQYKKNLNVIVKKLKATNAKLIFATTTPYPDTVGKPLRKPGMPVKYNKAAIKIMNKNNISINDLYSFMLPRMGELQRPNNVHFTPEGSSALAFQVTDRIKETLSE